MTKWREVKLSEVTEFIDGDRGKNYPKQHEYLDEGYCLFLNTSNVTNEGFNFNKVNYISKEKDLVLRKGRLEYNDLILTTRGTIGNIAHYKEGIYYPMRINSSMLILRGYNDTASQRFIYYLVKTKSFKEFMNSYSSGSAQPQLPVKDLRQIKIKIPDLETQEKISDILSTYDELIENNNRRIEILERTAEEIYREWFVRMRFPGHENTKFIKGVPEGWEIKRVGDVISFDIGGGWGKEKIESNFIEKAYVIRGTDIPDMEKGKFNYGLLRYHTESNLKNRKLKDGDIIFEASGGSSSQRLGRTIYINHEILSMYDENVIPASFCKLIRIDNKESSWFFNCYLNYAYKKEILSTFEVQSTGILNFGFTSFKEHHNILIPNKSLIESFYNTTYEIYQNIVGIWGINQNLIKQRDLLLPRLMNGTIQVK